MQQAINQHRWSRSVWKRILGRRVIGPSFLEGPVLNEQNLIRNLRIASIFISGS